MKNNNDDIWIGPAIPGDGKGIAAVHKTTWLATYPNARAGITENDILSMAKFFDNAERVKEWEEKILANGRKGYFICVAKHDSRVVAFCGVQKFENHNQLMALYIAPGFQKRGIGKRLWCRVFEWMGPDKRIVVTPVVYNLPAIGFYEKIGFKKVSGKFSAKKMPTGKVLRMVEMEIIPLLSAQNF